MSDIPANTDGPTEIVTQSKTSHWCEFTKTWPGPEICITCGEEAPVLYDSDTCSSGDADETRAHDPFIQKASKEEKVYAAVRSTPFIAKTSKEEKVYAAVRSTPFIAKASKEEKVVKSKKPKKVGKASKMEKVVKSKKPKKATKKTLKINGFYKKLFKDYPLSTFVPTSPPFSDGQIDEFQCQHCGIHKELDDETWYACPYAIFHGLIKSESG